MAADNGWTCRSAGVGCLLRDRLIIGQGGIDTVMMERKLAAIFSADAQGYSRLMGENEEVTILTLMTYLAVMTTLIEEYRGRVVDTPGDNLLAEFGSVVDAMECAVAIQDELSERNAMLPAHRTMAFRIGINLGDVVVEGARIYGEGVNLAARLEGLAEGGGICISGPVYDQIATRLDFDYVDLGEQRVKNIVGPVRAYQVCLDSPSAALVPMPRQRVGSPFSVKVILGLMLVLAGFMAAHLVLRGVQPPVDRSALKTANRVVNNLSLQLPTLEVRPFTASSHAPIQQELGIGLTQNLITELTKRTDLFVVVSEGQSSPPQAAGRYLLRGSTHAASHRIRVTVQLIEAGSGQHLWAERYDHDVYDLFKLQDLITQRIVRSLTDGFVSAPD